MEDNYLSLTEMVNHLPEDEKWHWIHDNQDTGITVFLDNDQTFAQFMNADGTPADDDAIIEFHHYLGWSEGIFELLTAFGIRCETV